MKETNETLETYHNLNPIKKIDFEMLRNQKSDLLEVIESLEMDAEQANGAGEEKYSKILIYQSLSLKGLLGLIDSIQDYAVDVLGKDENEVFDLEG